MVQIYFFSPLGYAPMKDATLKSLIGGSHGWQGEGQSWVFGLAEVKDGFHAADVRDRLESLGVITLPPFSDNETPIEQKVYTALSQHISPSDRTRAIAKKLGKLHPALRPHE